MLSLVDPVLASPTNLPSPLFSIQSQQVGVNIECDIFSRGIYMDGGAIVEERGEGYLFGEDTEGKRDEQRRVSIVRNSNANRNSNNLSSEPEHELPGGTPIPDVLIDVDKQKFSHVLHNIFSNALKFTPRGGFVRVTAYVRRDQSTWGGSGDPALVIDVKDTGAGLTRPEMRMLFKNIIQFQPEELKAGGGSGLGLFSEC